MLGGDLIAIVLGQRVAIAGQAFGHERRSTLWQVLLLCTSTAAVDREVRRFGVSALVGAVTAASFGVCEDN